MVGRAVAAQRAPNATPPVPLTNREREVLALVAEGLSNAEIGNQLYISVTTVKTHVANLMTKTGGHNRVQLAVSAGALGITPPEG